MAEKPISQNKAELIDDLFASTRTRVEMILTLLAEKLEKRVGELEVDAKTLPELDAVLQHLERVIFLAQMNRAKVRDLVHMAPKKYQRVMSDIELMQELRPTRDSLGNFPPPGPRGPREGVAEAPEEDEAPPGDPE